MEVHAAEEDVFRKEQNVIQATIKARLDADYFDGQPSKVVHVSGKTTVDGGNLGEGSPWDEAASMEAERKQKIAL
jgi:hypothetical protein